MPPPIAEISAQQPPTRLRNGWTALKENRSWWLLVVVLTGWFLLTLGLVTRFTHHRLAANLRKHSADLLKHEEAVSYQFDHYIAFLYGVPSTLTDDPRVRSFLTEFSRKPIQPGASRAERRSALAMVPGAAVLNQHLATVCRELGMDIAWVVDDRGECIASSNSDKPESFVGIDYADRDYFKSAMAGQRGRQYAVGRTTNIPGIYFSSPIEDQGRPRGAVVAKIDVSRLSQWFSRFDCFVTDESGVIIVSSDPRLELCAVSGAPVFQATSEDLEKKYKRRAFETLSVGQVDPRLAPYASAMFSGSRLPYMLVRRQRHEDGYTIYTFTQVPEVEHLRAETYGLLVLVFIAGAAFILLAWGLRNYLHHLRALRESEAQNRALFSAIPDLIFTNRRNGEYLAVHAPEPGLLALPADQMLHRRLEEVLPGPIASRLQEAFVTALDLGGVQEVDYALCIGGRELHFEARVAPCSEDMVLTIVHDVTRRKATEEQQRKLEGQLQQAQKMDSLGSLAGGIAHDMNNVLAAILGFASANLEAHSEGSRAHHAFTTIARAAVRGGEMVKTLLRFAHKSPAEERELDLNEVLREEIRMLERTTLARVRLETDLQADLRPMRGDANALNHAFMNLCVNAVDAMPENGVLTLRTRNLDGNRIEVSVEDTGSGMPKEVLERAMEPFFTTKTVGKGTGLGLSMVYSTVKAHQGQMEIHSAPNQGTQVRMRFPACEPSALAAAPQAGAQAEAPQQVLSVLLVDDDELIQSSMQTLIGTLGHELIVSPSGEEALATIEFGYRPDVVILDMNMPGLGGKGTLPRLRSLLPEVPVLLATGRVDQAALDLAAAHPRVTLFPKPFSLKALQQRLASLGQD
jgi:C4-dicarboxylate-specific signal transduction histidine kinase/CheY-like chemotaxis protein